MKRLIDVIIEDNNELVELIVNFSKLNDCEINNENKFEIINANRLKKFINNLEQSCTLYLESTETNTRFTIQVVKINKSGKQYITYRLLGMHNNINHLLLLDYYQDNQFDLFIESLKRNCVNAILNTILNITDIIVFTAMKERQLIDLKTTGSRSITKEILLSKLYGCIIPKGYRVSKQDEDTIKEILVKQKDSKLLYYNFGDGFIVTYKIEKEPEIVYWHVEKEYENGRSFCVSLADSIATNLTKVKKFIEIDSL